VTGASGYMALKMLVIYNDVSALNTVYGEIGTTLGSFDTIMDGTTLDVVFTPIDNTAVVQFSRTLIENIVAVESTTTLPNDLNSVDGLIDLLDGDGIIDLNSSELPEDLNSGSGTNDMNAGSGTIDLNT
jgi:hypothetical protein